MGSNNTITLKEHNYAPIPDKFDKSGLIEYLNEVWINRLMFGLESIFIDDTGDYSVKQPFFSFTHDNRIKANNYVGFTHWQQTRFEVLPKVFEGKEAEELWPHLIYWLSYCRKVNFPFSTVDTSFKDTNDFPEALIYTFALHTRTVIQSTPFSRYESLTEESEIMKGRLDFNQYLNEKFTKGNPHKLVIEHTPLLYNNLLNQIIKSVAVRLQGVCRFEDTFHILQDIVFQMEEVDEVNVTTVDCDRVHLNRLYAEYSQVLHMCKFFLSDGHLSNDTGSYQSFSFMLPMELIFEDYVAGFLERQFDERYITSYQSRGWLTDQNVFQLRYDIVLKNRRTGNSIIVDAKYKMRSYDGKGKKGIYQDDLYQMLAYAVRKNCNQVVLLYPEHSKSKPSVDKLSISSEMFSEGPVKIYAANIPFVHNDLSQADTSLRNALNKILGEIDKE